MQSNLITYYKLRAAEYDKIYLKPERQEHLREASEIIRTHTAEKNVLEIACGTGYWTEQFASTANSVLATDINEEVLNIARHRNYPGHNVQFVQADFSQLTPQQNFNCLFGGFIWSHISLNELDAWLSHLVALVQPGSELIFIDNRYVEGSSTPIAETDETGNTYQHRLLNNATPYKVMKNFPTAEFLQRKAKSTGLELKFYELPYYWIAVFRSFEKR